MLEIEGLEVAYGSVKALHGVSLRVEEGETVALVGPNGAGKSSTLNAVAGIAPLMGGEIRLEGTSIASESPERVASRGLACVPEGGRIFGTLSVRENLLLGATLRRNGDDTNSADEEAAMFELFPVLNRFAEQQADRLSGGEKQQLAIARALMSRPRLLLLDEPTLGLGPRIVDLVFEVLAKLREEGVTILLVEQAAARAVAFADHSYLLRNGVVAVAAPRDEFLRTVDLGDAYLGSTTVTE